MGKTNPTDAATRAARPITDQVTTRVLYGGAISYEEMATIIDRETDLPALLAENERLRYYKDYVERNLERIDRDGWTPICFAEFCESSEYRAALAQKRGTT